MLKIIKFLTFIFFVSIYPSNAHYFSESHSKWNINGVNVDGIFNVFEIEATRVLKLPDIEKFLYEQNLSESEAFIKYLEKRLKVISGNDICIQIKPMHLIPSKEGSINVAMKFQCKQPEAIKIINNAFFDIIPSHIHIARIYEEDSIILEKALFYNDQSINLAENKNEEKNNNFLSSIFNFIKIGIEHILNGYDHLLFIAGLVLLISSIRKLLIVITGFTLGHSITLIFSTLGYATPNMMLVESLIGFTIFFLGLEYFLERTKKFKEIFFLLIAALILLLSLGLINPILISKTTLIGIIIFSIGYFGLYKNLRDKNILIYIITVLFGLIHGYGFGSFLLKTEIQNYNLIYGLAGFNVGVEIGQIIFVSLILIFLKLISYLQLRNFEMFFKNLIFVLVISFGIFWFVSRIIN